ncbi:urease accessory protein UreD [Peribacillus simplex]|uniref:Urease accessory protein UreD n=1 Tax=Peribacillus simplex TaxID=1478 RepID=A0A9W4KQJ8_9BACI|nr:urease accessory protein UreD [Peribacillus simplex]MDR4927073.1 urease accessory protein UreD [Peribacillus simplex]WHX92361.1 urease accessory protein UreD [Peribacillus simplex]CAH0161705.1 Urease accessory protein UreD [Peribacillus simplex]
MRWTGSIRLKAVLKNDRTILSDTYYDGAFKLSRPVFLDELSPTYFLIHVGGGYVGGDRYHQLFCLEEGATMTLTTQSATKIYKTMDEPALQRTELVLKKGSFLTYVQDPVIAYESARYIQDTTIHMECGAGLLLTDIFTPGWSESRTAFTYDWIRSKMNVFHDGKRLIMDHLLLNPSDEMDSVLLLEGYSHFGSLLLIHEEVDGEVMAELDEMLSPLISKVRIGFSRLPINGLMLRVLANQTQQIEKVFSVCEDLFRRRVLREGAIFYRKY